MENLTIFECCFTGVKWQTLKPYEKFSMFVKYGFFKLKSKPAKPMIIGLVKFNLIFFFFLKYTIDPKYILFSYRSRQISPPRKRHRENPPERPRRSLKSDGKRLHNYPWIQIAILFYFFSSSRCTHQLITKFLFSLYG